MGEVTVNIQGYRQLSDEEQDAINGVKDMAELVGQCVAGLRESEGLDQRWVSIGATHLQQGFMALVRGIAQPESF